MAAQRGRTDGKNEIQGLAILKGAGHLSCQSFQLRSSCVEKLWSSSQEDTDVFVNYSTANPAPMSQKKEDNQRQKAYRSS